MSHLTIIVPTKQNPELVEEIRKQIPDTDTLIVEELPKFPARKLDDIIRVLNIPDTFIVLINPLTLTIKIGTFELFRLAAGQTDKVFVKRGDDDTEDFMPAEMSLLYSDDIIGFSKLSYRRLFIGISSNNEWFGCMKEAIKGIGRSQLMVPKERYDEKYDYNMAKERARLSFLSEIERMKQEESKEYVEGVLAMDREKRLAAIEERKKARERKREAEKKERAERNLKMRSETTDFGKDSNHVPPPRVSNKQVPLLEKTKTKVEIEKLSNWMDD